MILRVMGVVLLAFALPALAYLAITMPTSGVDARGMPASDKDVCFLRIGPSFMQFSAYQIRDPRARLCKEIPDVGLATIVIDQVDPELRDMTTDIRIIKDIDGGTGVSGTPSLLNDAAIVPEALDPVTEKHVLPKPYPTGIIEFEHRFTSPGQYHAMVTVKNEHGQIYVSEFPFSVGQSNKKIMLLGGLVVAFCVGAGLLYWKYAGLQGLWSRIRNV